MKFLVTGDFHMDAVTAGVRRLPEVENFVLGLRQTIRDESVDVVIVLGDYFDPGTMRAHELTTKLFGWAYALEDGDGVTPSHVFWLTGNHDVVETSEGWTVLSPFDAGMCPDRGPHRVAERPSVIEEWPGLSLLCLPYVARAAFDEEELERTFAHAASKFNPADKLIVATHMSIPGAVLSSESKEMSRGRELDFPVEIVAELKPDLVFAGHYHKAQTIDVGPFKVHCPGSPLRNNFGERDDLDKGFIIAEI